MNEILAVVEFLLAFGFILLFYRIWGKTGLYIWTAISTIIANIQTPKSIEVFGIPMALGTVIYSTTFLVTDILCENHGKKEANKAVHIGFFAMVTMTLLMTLTIYFIPSPQDFAHESIKTIFRVMPRIVLGSFIAYYISQFHDVNAYEFWRKKWPADKYFWVRNNFSTLVSQFIDSAIFIFIVWTGVFEFNVMIKMLFSTYIAKAVIALLDTPFLYIAKKMKKKYNLEE